MRAAVLRGGAMVVDDVDDPKPGPAQLLAEVKACGICGSDLHFVHHGSTMMSLGEEMEGGLETGEPKLDLGRDVFMGHEFSAEVLELGPGADGPKPGTIVTSIPILLTGTGVRNLAYSNDMPAGYGERLVLSKDLVQEVPNGLDPKLAALTEPMAVGLHAVNRSAIEKGEGAVVLGCGPVGLGVIAALAGRDVGPVVASDYSPARRALAEQMGADHVVDPAGETPFEVWSKVGGGRQLVVFEAVGVPGLINDTLRVAPLRSRIVVVGVCMEQDTIIPYYGIGKELSLQFVLGYDPAEFAASLRSIAEGEIDVRPMITGEVDLAGVPGAFDDLADPERHCKILVVP